MEIVDSNMKLNDPKIKFNYILNRLRLDRMTVE